jgi:pantothenate synthetase
MCVPCPCSRNARLSPEARSNALSISAALKWAQQAAAQGEVVQADAIVATVQQRIAAAGGDVDYVEVRLLLLSIWCCRVQA